YNRGRHSIRVGAERLAAVAGAELLVDAEPAVGVQAPDDVAIGRVVPAGDEDTYRQAGARERPAVDRLLEEPDRAVAEGEVRAAGVEARGRQDERPGLVVAGQVLGLLLDVDRVELGEHGVAVVARGPPVPVVERAGDVVGLAEQAVGPLAEGDRV